MIKDTLDWQIMEAAIQKSLHTATIPENSIQKGGKNNIAFIIFLFDLLVMGFVLMEVSKEEK